MAAQEGPFWRHHGGGHRCWWGAVQVYKGVYHDQPVAVKVCRKPSLTATALRQFQKEVAILQACRHENLVQFIGACTMKVCHPCHLVPHGLRMSWAGGNSCSTADSPRRAAARAVGFLAVDVGLAAGPCESSRPACSHSPQPRHASCTRDHAHLARPRELPDMQTPAGVVTHTGMLAPVCTPALLKRRHTSP